MLCYVGKVCVWETLLGPGAPGGAKCRAGFNARGLESYQREGFVEEDGIRHRSLWVAAGPAGVGGGRTGRGTWLDSVTGGEL